MEARAASGSLGIRWSVLEARLGHSSDQACSYSTRSSAFCLCQYRYLGVYFTCNIHFQACPCRAYQLGSRKFFVGNVTGCSESRGEWPASCRSTLPARAAPKLEGGPTVDEPQERCSSYSHQGFSRAAGAGEGPLARGP